MKKHVLIASCLGMMISACWGDPDNLWGKDNENYGTGDLGGSKQPQNELDAVMVVTGDKKQAKREANINNTATPENESLEASTSDGGATNDDDKKPKKEGASDDDQSNVASTDSTTEETKKDKDAVENNTAAKSSADDEPKDTKKDDAVTATTSSDADTEDKNKKDETPAKTSDQSKQTDGTPEEAAVKESEKHAPTTGVEKAIEDIDAEIARLQQAKAILEGTQ